MNNEKFVKESSLLAAKIRRNVVRMIGCEGHTGHLGGACSCADILAVLYGCKLRFDPANPDWSERDRFLCSKGHVAIAQYAAMAEMGYFPVGELSSVKALGSRLQGHPDRLKTPGIEAGTGSLGQGLSIANGLALGMRLDQKVGRVYCLMGDGEMEEGQIWEAAMAAAHYQLDHVVGIVDCNQLQATGRIVERMNVGKLGEKWQSFGWNVLEIDGHDVAQILNAVDEAAIAGSPTVILANTVKGKGISFAENVVGFHNGALTPDQYALALEEIHKQMVALEEV